MTINLHHWKFDGTLCNEAQIGEPNVGFLTIKIHIGPKAELDWIYSRRPPPIPPTPPPLHSWMFSQPPPVLRLRRNNAF